MNESLQALYQDLIVEHGCRPRFFYELPDYTMQQHGHNPLCGDSIALYAHCQENQFTGLSFTGSGCAICIASASLMVERLQGANRAEADALFRAVLGMLTAAEATSQDGAGAELGKLEALRGVSNFPLRVKCATLPWHTLKHLLQLEGESDATTP